MQPSSDPKQRVYSVSELTACVKHALEQSPFLTSVWIRGEISNLSYNSSGHIYFKLKDKGAVISATFFKYANKNLKFRLEDGMSIFAFGGVSLYEKGGSYQFNVLSVELEGQGELQQRIEVLKKKLAYEGLFAPERKKKLPFLPRRIGIATSPTGAAVRDIIKVALRRYPNLEIVIAPAKVQGEDAAETIVRAIGELNKPKYGLDLIIAGRGGGSFEDLMAFNEEAVVRAFAESRLPIVSAVGHQIDHPLSDEAADMYAPTPSAAAEKTLPVRQDLYNEISYLLQRAESALMSRLNLVRLRLDSVTDKRCFKMPMELVERRELATADLENRVTLAFKDGLSAKRKRFMAVPDIKLLAVKNLTEQKHRFKMSLQALDDRSPLNIIRRGYSIAKNRSGNIIRSVDEASLAEKISVYVADGSLGCIVDSINKGDVVGKEAKDRLDL